MVALGDVCSRIESITPGYVTSAGTGPSALTPVWYIATDTRNYRLDTLTGELSRGGGERRLSMAVSLKNKKKVLDKRTGHCYTARVQQSRNGAPSHPRPEPKGQHGESSPEHLYSAWFCCDAGAIQADAFYFFCLEVLSHR